LKLETKALPARYRLSRACGCFDRFCAHAPPAQNAEIRRLAAGMPTKFQVSRARNLPARNTPMASSASDAAFILPTLATNPCGIPHPHIKLRIDTRANCPLDIPTRVVQQNLVVADIDADGRHARKSTMQG
jgi:hypothetical protein